MNTPPPDQSGFVTPLVVGVRVVNCVWCMVCSWSTVCTSGSVCEVAGGWSSSYSF